MNDWKTFTPYFIGCTPDDNVKYEYKLDGRFLIFRLSEQVKSKPNWTLSFPTERSSNHKLSTEYQIRDRMNDANDIYEFGHMDVHSDDFVETQGKLKYQVRGKYCYVYGYINGTSKTRELSFQLPFVAAENQCINGYNITDNGVLLNAAGSITVKAGTNVATVIMNDRSNGFAPVGFKNITINEFRYKIE